MAKNSAALVPRHSDYFIQKSIGDLDVFGLRNVIVWCVSYEQKQEVGIAELYIHLCTIYYLFISFIIHNL